MYNVGVIHNRVFEFFSGDYDQWLLDAGINYYYINSKELVYDDKLQTLITGSISVDDLHYFPKLEAIIVPFAGINQLDLEVLKSKGIRVFNTTAHACFVAERGLALTLAVMGKIVLLHKQLEKGEWGERVAGAGGTGIKWTSIFNKKIAIYGYGTIGKEIRKLILPFKGDVGILNYKNRQFEGVKLFNGLEELASWCDIFIVAAPLNDSTKSSINASVLKQLKDKVLINIGRGPIINEDDLYDSIMHEGLQGFGSDVWYNYPSAEVENCFPSKYPIQNFSHVVMTPHNGGGEINADIDKYKDVANQLKEISKGDFTSQVS